MLLYLKIEILTRVWVFGSVQCDCLMIDFCANMVIVQLEKDSGTKKLLCQRVVKRRRNAMWIRCVKIKSCFGSVVHFLNPANTVISEC